MASLFDPSAFIAAEQSQQSQTVADYRAGATGAISPPEAAENGHSRRARTETIAESQQSQPVAADIYPWSRGLAIMSAVAAPTGMESFRWKRLVRIARQVSDEWGGPALNAGWHPLELFGCNPDPFARRVDRNGLVASLFNMLTPLEIIDLNAKAAVMKDRHGAIMKYYPFGARGQQYLWTAYLQIRGP